VVVVLAAAVVASADLAAGATLVAADPAAVGDWICDGGRLAWIGAINATKKTGRLHVG